MNEPVNLKSLDLLKFSEVLKKRPFRASLERTVLRQLVAVILNFFKCSSPCLLSLKVIWSFYFYSSHLSQLASFTIYSKHSASSSSIIAGPYSNDWSKN